MLPQVFIDRLTETIGRDNADRFLEAMASPASVSVRLNPYKKPNSSLPILEGASSIPWNPYGYILKERPVFTLHPLFHAGVYYVQDSSAMFPGYLFRKALALKGKPSTGPVRVLDLCAAPGGKTTDMAASLREVFGDDFILISNEVMRKRASVLSDNVAIWGDANVIVTSVDPGAFSSLGAFFDIIVADVPCSGEGMFRKDEKAVADWSPQTVDLCASRQRRILSDVWPSLKQDGLLIYSTCTFARQENDENVSWIASELGGEVISFGLGGHAPDQVLETENGYLLVPGLVPGEGQYAAAVRKTSEAPSESLRIGDIHRLHPLRYGVRKGEMKGRDFVPDPDWILSLSYERGTYPEVEVDKQTALKYLHKDSIELPDSPLGYNVLVYRGIPFGIVKNIGRRCNNLHPQSRRILMDINI